MRDATGECLPYGEPNVTSLHEHGLHTNVDGKGDYPLKLAHRNGISAFVLEHPRNATRSCRERSQLAHVR